MNKRKKNIVSKIYTVNIDYLETNKKKTRYYPIKYIKNKGCWVCVSHKSNNEYLRIRYNGKQIQLHRFMFEYFKNKLNPNQVVRHKCDNPLCINPKHLLSGTILDNIKDRQKRNRQAKGEKIANSKLKEKDVDYILKSDKSGLALSKELKVNHGTINRIRKSQTWKHIKRFKKEKYCLECNKILLNTRHNKKFCDNKCKSKYWNRR